MDPCLSPGCSIHREEAYAHFYVCSYLSRFDDYRKKHLSLVVLLFMLLKNSHSEMRIKGWVTHFYDVFYHNRH